MAINLSIRIEKKHVYVFVALFVLLLGIALVNAFGSSNPSVVGHSAGELIVDSTSIVDGSINASKINTSQIQLRVSDTSCNGANVSIKEIYANGTVVCETDDDTVDSDWVVYAGSTPPGNSDFAVHAGRTLVGSSTLPAGSFISYIRADSSYGGLLVDQNSGSTGVKIESAGANPALDVDGVSTSGNALAEFNNVNGIGVRSFATNTGATAFVGIGGSGGNDFLAQGAGTDYGSTSSVRWKNNVNPIENALNIVMNTRGVTFDWDEEHGGRHDVGFIAEEIGEYIPEIVMWEQNSSYAVGLDYSRVTPVLLEAIKEQQNQIEQLTAIVCGLAPDAEVC
jgi:hypothetical protein